MAEPYTSEDYIEALASHEGRVSACVDYRAKAAAALRIAAKVMEPGVIERAVMEGLHLIGTGQNAGEGKETMSETIRAALTGDQP